MCSVLDLVVSKGIRFNCSLWVEFMKIPSMSTTWGPLFIATLLVQGVLSLMQFWIDPVSDIP